MVEWLEKYVFELIPVTLYVLKFGLLAGLRPLWATLLILPFYAATIPVMYHYAYWDNPHMWNDLAIYIGLPVEMLTVPALSFAYDAWRKHKKIEQRLWVTVLRLPIECVVFLVWCLLWYFLPFVFGWFWI